MTHSHTDPNSMQKSVYSSKSMLFRSFYCLGSKYIIEVGCSFDDWTYNYLIIPMRKWTYSFIYYIITLGNFFLSIKLLFLNSDSHLPKKIYYLLDWKRFEMINNAFYFILKALFVLKILKLLSRLFGHIRKTAWLER